METVDLICEKRETRPKGLVHRIRHEGRVPGIIYGNQHAATAVAVPAADLRSRVATAARQRLIRITKYPQRPSRPGKAQPLRILPIEEDQGTVLLGVEGNNPLL